VSRVLVTGATGFIGHHLPAALRARGHEVSVASRSSGVDLLEPGDAESLLAAVRPTHLVHLAWYAVPGAYWTSPENVRWVEASLALLRAFVAAGGERAVLAGTCAEYDWSGGVCAEDTTPLRPWTLYGHAKNALREVAEAYAEEAALSLAWGRIFFVYGPHEPDGRLVSSVARALVRGEEAPTTEGSQRRDFLHSADLADAFAALLGSEARGAVNLGSGDAVAVRDVVEEVARAAGRPDLLRVGAVPARPDEAPLVVADATRLRDEVGWSPARTLEQGIADTVAWWRSTTLPAR
jgi:nucleoside-diphosphate-sugar epimerase